MLNAWRTTGAAVAVTVALFAAAPSAASADPPALWATTDTDLAESSAADEVTAADPDEADADAESPADDEESFPGSEAESGTSRDSTADTQFRKCLYSTAGDYVHISNTLPKAASAHGWWIDVNCKGEAWVTIKLQQLINGNWTDAGTVGRERVSSGGGSGNRATGRATCANSARTTWRSVVDVDLIGKLDLPDQLITTGRDLDCRH